MAYSPIAVANHFIDLASRDSVGDMTPMKIQKLVFYAHGWHWAIADRPLINAQVEAWEYGPVVRSLYNRLREYGNQVVPGRVGIHEFDKTGNSLKDWGVRYLEPSMDDEGASLGAIHLESIAIVDATWDEYKKFSAVQLSNMTHLPGTPWTETVGKERAENGGILPDGTDIPASLIKSFFRGIIEGNRQSDRREAAGV